MRKNVRIFGAFKTYDNKQTAQANVKGTWQYKLNMVMQNYSESVKLLDHSIAHAKLQVVHIRRILVFVCFIAIREQQAFHTNFLFTKLEAMRMLKMLFVAQPCLSTKCTCSDLGAVICRLYN